MPLRELEQGGRPLQTQQHLVHRQGGLVDGAFAQRDERPGRVVHLVGQLPEAQRVVRRPADHQHHAPVQRRQGLVLDQCERTTGVAEQGGAVTAPPGGDGAQRQAQRRQLREARGLGAVQQGLGDLVDPVAVLVVHEGVEGPAGRREQRDPGPPASLGLRLQRLEVGPCLEVSVALGELHELIGPHASLPSSVSEHPCSISPRRPPRSAFDHLADPRGSVWSLSLDRLARSAAPRRAGHYRRRHERWRSPGSADARHPP